MNEKILLKWQPTSDAALGIMAKFRRPFEGPWLITKIIPPSYYEISDKEGKIREAFNTHTALKKNLREPGDNWVYCKKKYWLVITLGVKET